MAAGSTNRKASRHILLPRAAAGLLVFAIGVACLGFLTITLAGDLSLWVTGRNVDATVTEQWVERLGDQTEGELTFHYYIRYEFTTPRGRVVSKVTTLGVTEWSSLSEGGTVRVTYFPLLPSHARLEERKFISIYVCGYIPFALIGLAAARAGWDLLWTSIEREEEPAA